MTRIALCCTAALLAIAGPAHAQSSAADGSVALPANPGQGLDATTHTDAATGATVQGSATGSVALPANEGEGRATSAHVDSSTGAQTGATGDHGAALPANAGQGVATTTHVDASSHRKRRRHPPR